MIRVSQMSNEINQNRTEYLTGKLMRVPGPQYFKAARSYALAAASSSSYAPVNDMLFNDHQCEIL